MNKNIGKVSRGGPWVVSPKRSVVLASYPKARKSDWKLSWGLWANARSKPAPLDISE